MASHLYDRMVTSLPRLVSRSDGSEPYNYTSRNGHVCAMPRPLTNTATARLAGGYDFTINEIVTGACACFTLLSLSALMFRHATHLSRPNEQLNILRICCYLPVFAVGCLLEVSFPNAYVYINPWLDFVQAITLCNFFLLMCQLVSPSDQHRDVFFAALEVPQKRNRRAGRQRWARRRGGGYGPGPEPEPEPINGLEWYRKMWVLVFQYPAVQAFVAILTSILESQGVYCLVSSKPHFGHLWLDIVHNVSLTLAIASCLRLYAALKGRLPQHRLLAKLAAFKLLVAITFIIQLVYWILRSIDPSPLRPTAYFSWPDVFIGTPVMATALLTVPFSVFFHFAYGVGPYYLDNAAGKHLPLAPGADPEPGAAVTGYQGGFLGARAWLAMLSPGELISGFVFGFRMLSGENRRAGLTATRRSQTGGLGPA